MDNAVNPKQSLDTGHAIYVGQVISSTKTSGYPNQIRYNIFLTNIMNPDETIMLRDHTPRVRNFSGSVMVNAAPVGAGVFAVRTGTGLWVKVEETVEYQERCK